MAKGDYYSTLGVERGADDAALKKAYRKLAMKYHPDKNPGDAAAEQKFKEANEAYDVLKDKQKRAAYDQFGHAAFENGGFGQGGFGRGGFGGRAGQAGGDAFSDVFEDLFGDFMGGRGGRQRQPRSAARRGADLRYNLTISLAEAFRGKDQSLDVSSTATCSDCGGSGAKKGSKPTTCPDCKGTGRMRMQQGFFVVERTCGKCQGAGQVISDPCRTCSGSGRVQKQKSLSVKIPAGVEEGTRIRLSGEGEAGIRGGPTGDLYLFISIKPHPLFKREGSTIFCQVPIPVSDAILGGEIKVPTLDGKAARVKIPAGTQAGKQFRLRGKGMPMLNSSRVGDMIIEVKIETPVNLSKAQKTLIREFASEDGKKWSPESSKFFSKVKELWDGLTD